MKKLRLRTSIVISVGVMMFMITNTKLNAAASASVEVTLLITKLSVVNVSSFPYIAANPGETKYAPTAMKWRNNGNVLETFKVKLDADTGGWRLVSTPPGADEFRVYAVWHHWVLKPEATEFNENDKLTTSDQTSTDAIFFNDSETHETAPNPLFPNDRAKDIIIKKVDQMAVKVPPSPKLSNPEEGGVRDLWFRIDFPASVTTTTPGKVNVIVTALAAE